MVRQPAVLWVLAGMTREQIAATTGALPCSKCGETKPVNAFRRTRDQYWISWCVDCYRLAFREYKAKHRVPARPRWTDTCPAGLHPVSEGSFTIQMSGDRRPARVCRQCNSDRAKAWRAIKRAEREPSHVG